MREWLEWTVLTLVVLGSLLIIALALSDLPS